jgi:hypothetical protein
MSIISPLLMPVSQPRQHLSLVAYLQPAVVYLAGLNMNMHLQPLREQSIFCMAFG